MSKLYGLLGQKLGHSISPQIHNLIYREIGIEGCYHIFEVEMDYLKNAVRGLNALGAKGANVTIPYKVSVMEYLDDISPEAKRIGAVNTISFKGSIVKGYNTDYHGFGMMLSKNCINVAGTSAVVLGSGGAAKSVIQYLIDNGAKDIKIASRNTEKLKAAYTKECEVISYDQIKYLGRRDIIINCTPCGMYPNEDCTPVNKEDLDNFEVAADLIYNPEETLFLKHAKLAGLKTLNGLYMLVAQAVVSEGIWNDIEVDQALVDKVYESIVAYSHHLRYA